MNNIEINEFLDETIGLPGTFKHLWLVKIILGSILVATIIYCLYLGLKKEKPLTPTQILIIAIEEMKSMAQDPLCPQKNIYFKAVFTLKTYLKNQLLINIDAKTDASIPKILEKQISNPEISKTLIDLLDRAYQVRFAGQHLQVETILSDIDSLERLKELSGTAAISHSPEY